MFAHRMKAGALAAFTVITVGFGLGNSLAQQSEPAKQKGQDSGMQQKQQRTEAQPRDWQNFGKDRVELTDAVTEGWLVVKLAARPGFNDLDVEVKDGVAMLSGKVASEAKKGQAARIALSTLGVTSIRNQLTVDPEIAKRGQPAISERELAKQVAQRIAANIQGVKAGPDWWFDGWRIEGPANTWSFVVEVDDHHVILEGEVPTVETMRKAVEAAAKVPGVRSVDSDLELGYPAGYARIPYPGDYYSYDYDNRVSPYGPRSRR